MQNKNMQVNLEYLFIDKNKSFGPLFSRGSKLYYYTYSIECSL